MLVTGCEGMEEGKKEDESACLDFRSVGPFLSILLIFSFTHVPVKVSQYVDKW
jgi:hypothetical protein